MVYDTEIKELFNEIVMLEEELSYDIGFNREFFEGFNTREEFILFLIQVRWKKIAEYKEINQWTESYMTGYYSTIS